MVQQIKHWTTQLVLPSLGYGLLAFLDKLYIKFRDRTALCLGTAETCPVLFRQSRKGNCSHFLPVPSWLSSSISTWHKKVPNKWLSSVYLSPRGDMGSKWQQPHCLQSWPAHSWTVWHFLDRNTEKQQVFLWFFFNVRASILSSLEDSWTLSHVSIPIVTFSLQCFTTSWNYEFSGLCFSDLVSCTRVYCLWFCFCFWKLE